MYEHGGLALHLPDLSIRNFRGIRSLSIQRLGRVTLLAGLNGVGKTAVLEAVHVYASGKVEQVLHHLLEKHQEVDSFLDEYDGVLTLPDYSALFHGRFTDDFPIISIGPVSGRRELCIEVIRHKHLSPGQKANLSTDKQKETQAALRIALNGTESLIPMITNSRGRYTPWPIRRRNQLVRRQGVQDAHVPVIDGKCTSIGPGHPTNEWLARLWDGVLFSDAERSAIDILGLIDHRIERIGAVASEGRSYSGANRRILVKLRENPNRVPLQSLGNGIVRLVAVALAIACSRNGFLVVDEVENGIHQSVQQGLWEMIIQAASKYNVQVLATTHSFDPVCGLAGAIEALDETDARLVRIDRIGNELKSVEYSAEDIMVAVEQDIEVR